jgi:hypothetical protein
MYYSCEKTTTYNNIRIFCESAKPAVFFFKSSRVRINLTRIRLITAHVTLAHATLNNRETARFWKKKANYSDRLASSSRNYNIEKNIKSRIFADKANKKG